MLGSGDGCFPSDPNPFGALGRGGWSFFRPTLGRFRLSTKHAAIERFIDGYLQRQEYYRCVAESCHERCHEALSQNGIRHIATFRAKGLERLREKLYNRVADGHAYETDEDIAKDIVDLAGARVALYFPAELSESVEVLSGHFEVLQKRTFPKKHSPRRGDDIYKYRFPGYSATHLLVKLKRDALRADQAHFAEALVEIQIASVFMHAWAEVEHDLVYKPLMGKSSVGEYSLLDQINGLALTGDLTLEHLQRAMKERITREERRFETHYDLASHLHNAYQRSSGEALMGRVDRLLEFLRRLRLDSPGLLQSYITTLPQAATRTPIVDQLRDHIIASSSEFASERRRIWSEVERSPSLTDSGTAETERAQATAERTLKKHWSTFEALTKQALTSRQTDRASRIQMSGITADTLRGLGFEVKNGQALLYAQQAYIRIVSDQWSGSTDDLLTHAAVLRNGIEHLYGIFPELLTFRSAE